MRRMSTVQAENDEPGPSHYEEQIITEAPGEDVYAGDEDLTFAEDIYEDDDGEININDVNVEEVVEESETKWIIPMGSTMNKEPPLQKTAGKPSIVLRTIDDLRLRPRVHVNAGRMRTGNWDNQDAGSSQNIDMDEGETGIPSLRAAFRMYGESALRKADETNLLDIEDEEFDRIEREVEEDKDDDSSLRDLSKRNQVVFAHKHWPLYWDRPIDFQEACEILSGMIEVDDKLICSTVPQQYKMEGTFIVDLRPLTNRHQVHCDGLGSWGKPTGRVRFYARHKTEQGRILRADDGRGRLIPGAKYVWKCMSKRYEHPSTAIVADGANRFIKKIYTALYPSDQNKAVGVAVVTYEWIGREPFDFQISATLSRQQRRPHGRVPPSGTWETSSFQNSITGVLPSTMNRFFGDIPMYSVGAVDFSTAASIILGGTAVEQSKVAHQVPQGYREAGTFVINTDEFPSDHYLRRDNNGGWGKPAGTSRYYAIEVTTGDAIRIDNGNKMPADHSHDIQILSKRYEHPQVDGRFVRKIYVGRPAPGMRREFQPRHRLAVITYYWKGEPEYFEPTRQNQISGGRHFLEEEYETLDMPTSPRSHETTSTAAKRRKTDSKNGLPLEITDSASEKEFRNAVWKKEYENQMRFSALLDRAEAFLCRLERASGNVLYTHENAETQQEWVQRNNTEEVNGQEQYNDCDE